MKNKKLVFIGIGLGVLIIAGIVLYFTLFANKITVKFVDETVTVKELKVKKKEAITLPETSKEGYTFEGWYYENIKLKDGVWFDHNVTVNAKWLKNAAPKMTITFNTDGGKEIASQTIECNTPLNLPTPTKEGYKFVNWLDKNEVIISNETKLVCQDITLKAKWEKLEEKKEETKPAEVKKEYTCPEGYTLNGTKCTITATPSYFCPTGTKVDGSLCIKTSDSNGGTRVCKEATVPIDGKGHTYTGGGDYYYIPNAYGNCAYHKWENYTTQTQCEQANDINHRTKWVSYLNGCYSETKMNNYEIVCASDYQYYSSADLSSKFGIHDNAKCLRKVATEARCDTNNGYVLTSGKCVKTIDATEK